MVDEIEDKPEPVAPVNLAIGIGVGDNTALVVKFADGERRIEPFIINALGGRSEISKIIPQLANVKYHDFYLGYRRVVEKRSVNSYAAQFIADHFR